MPFTDREILAYVDGELPAGHAKAIANACATDAELAAKVRQLRESRDALRHAFASKLDEPVPDRLLALLREAPKVGAPPAPAPSPALPPRVPTRAPTRSRVWIPMALAASIALAVGVALRWQGQQGAPENTVALIDDQLLQDALDRRASGEPQRTRDAEIMPTSSLTDARGRYCREYEASLISGKIVGVACRDADRGWITQVAKRDAATAASGNADEFQPASGASEDLTQSLGRITRLTPAEEESAIENSWGARTK